MPIKPENRHRYPKNWKAIRAATLARAANRCQWCGVENHSHVLRAETKGRAGTMRRVRIVLTIAHLDHTPENCAPENLAALCQKCHLAYDAAHHAKNARETRRRNVERVQPSLFTAAAEASRSESE